MIQYKSNCYIITGAPGSGKSAIIKQLRELNFDCVDEPARQILSEQRSFSGRGVPEIDPDLFSELLLSRAIFQYNNVIQESRTVFFDRGIPDNAGYASLFNIDMKNFHNAAEIFRYNNTVFVLDGEEEIYKTDAERKMSYDQACRFGKIIQSIYAEHKYVLVDVPMDSIKNRVQYILDRIAE